MRYELTRLREDALLSRKQLAKTLGVAERSVLRYEAGTRTPEMEIRRPYADALGCPVATLNAAIRNEPPPNGYHAPSSGLDMLTTLEQTCQEFRTLELAICPGLLQTPEYATAVEMTSAEQPPSEEIERRVSERMGRQAALTKVSPLRLFALLDRSILERELGGPAVMDGLRSHIREMNERPNVEIRLLSEPARIAAARGPFQLLTGDNSIPFMVVTEDLTTGFAYRDGRTVVDTHHDLWRHLWSVSHEVP